MNVKCLCAMVSFAMLQHRSTAFLTPTIQSNLLNTNLFLNHKPGHLESYLKLQCRLVEHTRPNRLVPSIQMAIVSKNAPKVGMLSPLSWKVFTRAGATPEKCTTASSDSSYFQLQHPCKKFNCFFVGFSSRKGQTTLAAARSVRVSCKDSKSDCQRVA